jgi:hypothetical protein
MAPHTPVPKGAKILRPVELRLKPGWRYDERNARFVADDGEQCAPGEDLPKGSRIALKLPALARPGRAALSKPEKELLRFVQVLLPARFSAADYVDRISSWPCVAEVRVAPAVGLP